MLKKIFYLISALTLGLPHTILPSSNPCHIVKKRNVPQYHPFTDLTIKDSASTQKYLEWRNALDPVKRKALEKMAQASELIGLSVITGIALLCLFFEDCSPELLLEPLCISACSLSVFTLAAIIRYQLGELSCINIDTENKKLYNEA